MNKSQGLLRLWGLLLHSQLKKEAKFQVEVAECKDVFFSSSFTDLNSVWPTKSNGETLIVGKHLIIGPNYHYLQS